MGIFNARRPSFAPQRYPNKFSDAPSSAFRFPFSLSSNQNYDLNNFFVKNPLQNGLVSPQSTLGWDPSSMSSSMHYSIPSQPLANQFYSGNNFSFTGSQSGFVFPCNEISACNSNALFPYYNNQPIKENACFGFKDRLTRSELDINHSWLKFQKDVILPHQRAHVNGLMVNPRSFKRPIDKTSKVNRWTIEEDRNLEKLVRELGDDKWAKIAQSMSNRVGKQCRERWRNHLMDSVKKNVAWTREEEAVMIALHRKGERWAKMSKCLYGRPENDVKNHWNATKRKLQAANRPPRTPFESYVAAFNKSTQYGPHEPEKDAADSHAQVQLWINIDKGIQEESAFAKRFFNSSN